MNKLPKGFDARFFVGRILEVVSFSANTVFFGFSDGVSVTVLSSLEHWIPSESNQTDVQSVPLSESKLMQLSEHYVIHAKGEADGTLTLSFDNGHVLKVFDDQAGYESYWINDGTHKIIV